MKHQPQPLPATATQRRSGVVLIIVLVLVVMLSFAGFAFLNSMSTEYEAAKLSTALTQARHTLASAESQLLWLASLSQQQRDALGGLHNNPALFQGQTLAHLLPPDSQNTAATEPENIWRFSIVSITPSPAAGTAIRFGMNSESARLHLATILRWEQTQPGAGKQALLHLPGISEPLAEAILDWIDPDDTPRPMGAESDYYATLPSPCRPANAIPSSLEELLTVRGMTASLLFGTPPPRTENLGVPDNPASTELAAPELGTLAVDSATSLAPSPSDTQNLNPSSITDPTNPALPLEHFLTVYSAERNTQPDGSPRIWLNQPDPAALRNSLRNRLPETLIRYILLARAYGIATAIPATLPEKNPADITAPALDASSFTATQSLRSLADLVDSAVIIPPSANQSPAIVRSPIQSLQPDADLLFLQLYNVASTDNTPIVTGRISLRFAPEPVLRGLPGLTPETAAALAAGRERLPPLESNSLLWPLRTAVLSPEQFRAVFPELNASGDVLQADLIAFRAAGGPLLRRKLILDAASSPPRRLHWKDLPELPQIVTLKSLLPTPDTPPNTPFNPPL